MNRPLPKFCISIVLLLTSNSHTEEQKSSSMSVSASVVSSCIIEHNYQTAKPILHCTQGLGFVIPQETVLTPEEASITTKTKVENALLIQEIDF